MWEGGGEIWWVVSLKTSFFLCFGLWENKCFVSADVYVMGGVWVE